MDEQFIAALENLRKADEEHASRLDEHNERLNEHDEELMRQSTILEHLKANMIENRASLGRIEQKLEGTIKDAFNAIPAWLGVLLGLIAAMIAAMSLGHDV